MSRAHRRYRAPLPSSVDPEPDPVEPDQSPRWQAAFGRLLACSLLVLLVVIGPLGMLWPGGGEPVLGGEVVAVAAAESLPAGTQILPQFPVPPAETMPRPGYGNCGWDGERKFGKAPRNAARPESWLREWRCVALLR